MKKIVGFLFAAFALIGFTVLFSCSLTESESDDTGISAPTIKASGTTYLISSSAIKNSTLKSNISYANIFRQMSESSDFSGDVTTMNIGQVNRNDSTVDFDSFIFEDAYTYTSYYYRYYVRYYDSADKAYLNSSRTEILAGKGSTEANLTPVDTTFTYNYTCNRQTENYYLTSTAQVTVPGSEFSEIDIIFSNGSSVKPFTLAEVEDNDPDYYVSSGATTDLHRVLPTSFLDVNLKVKGIIGICNTTEATETSKFDYYYWTNLADANVKIYETDTNGDVLQDGVTSTTMEVPSIAEPSNGFDYSSKIDSGVSLDSLVLESGVVLDLSL